MINEFDVCIIGSGPSGAFAAYELAAKGINVAVVEAGDEYLDSNAENLFDGKESKIDESIDFGFSQQVGGASNLWAGGLAKMDDIDLCERPQFGFSGWPISIDELNLFYQRVDRIIGIKTHNDDALRTSDSIKRSKLQFRRMMVLDVPFCTTQLVKNVENITLFKNSSAFMLELNSEHNCIAGVNVFDSSSCTRKKIKAKYYVLAAGTLTNVRLLLHSFSTIKSEISDLYNNIGRRFSTHPKGYIGTLKLFKSIEPDHPLISIHQYHDFISRYQIGLKEESLINFDVLNHCLRLDSSFTSRASRLLDFSKSLLHSVPFLSNNGRAINMLSKFGIILFRFIDNVSASGSKKNGLPVRGFFDQVSCEKNRIELSPNLSPSGLPLAKITWEFSDEDWKNVELFIDYISNELRNTGVGELIYKRPVNKSFTGIHSHFIGGTRIGHDSVNSVVDKNLKVHGVRNLYVSGPSVFPSFGYANPFYTIAALSVRLADNLLVSLKKY